MSTAEVELFCQLEWDSTFFSLPVARIERDPGHIGLPGVLTKLRADGFKLVYYGAAEEAGQGVLRDFGGRHVDLKTTYVRSLDQTEAASAGVASFDIVPWTSAVSEAEMMHLAVQSGVYSRYAVDPRVPRERFEALYALWITKSMRREIADETLIAVRDSRLLGLITLGHKAGRADIGLVAVDAAARGQRVGETLVRSAVRWFAAKGERSCQVVTQGANVPACRLYEKCGFTRESAVHFYHFWL